MLSRIYPGAAGYEFFQGLSLLLFFLVFAGVIVSIIFMKKDHINKMSNMPLDLKDKQGTNYGDHQ